MDFIYIVKLTPKKSVIHKASGMDDCIEYIKNIHPKSTYLENRSIGGFESDYRLKDGVYIIADDDTDIVFVYKLKTKLSEGYVYNQEYKTRRVIQSYELIESQRD